VRSGVSARAERGIPVTDFCSPGAERCPHTAGQGKRPVKGDAFAWW